LNFELKSGDQIDVITATSKPTINWLDYVTSEQRKKIKKCFKRKHQENW
jgi:(p)ppGpp synthase/HD superfamily hydrolase